MAERDEVTRLGRLLGAVADQHHQATGGTSDGWAEWYAERLQGQIDDFVGFSPSVEQISGWLEEADRRHREENPDTKWPYFYAERILDSAPPR